VTTCPISLTSPSRSSPGSDQFSDYRGQLVSEVESEDGIVLYGEQAGISIEGGAFTEQLRAQLGAAASQADKGFPDKEYLQIENGEPILKRLRRNPDPEGLQKLERMLKDAWHPSTLSTRCPTPTIG
jgi:hypothetical protein